MAYFCIMSAARLIPFALAAAIQCCDSEEDRAFMTSLYLNNSRRLFKYAFHLCGNRQDAEDAVQDAFLSLVPKSSELRAMQTDRVTAYLFTTLKHAVWLAYRKKKRITETEQRRLSKYSAEEVPSFDYTFDEMMETLPRLSEKDQVLLQMKYFLRMSDSEIADRFQVKPCSVKMMVRRARQRLIELIGKGDEKNVKK